jgi:hypothetical protein
MEKARLARLQAARATTQQHLYPFVMRPPVHTSGQPGIQVERAIIKTIMLFQDHLTLPKAGS